MARRIDITGKKFGRLTALRYLGKGKWHLECQCGKTTEAHSSNVKNGHTASCGCLRIEKSKATGYANRTHGHRARGRRSATYQSWDNMKARCLNPNNLRHKDYGGRGITVCQRWMDSFEAFLEDMGPRPKGCTLDRIDNSLGYSKDNCRWADNRTQANNKRTNRTVSYMGQSKPIGQHCRDHNLNYETVRSRLNRGWDIDRALGTPTRSPFKGTGRPTL